MSFLAPLLLVAARARHRPGRWLLTALGLAVATAFSVSVAAEGTIAGDQAARSSLAALSAADRAVVVTWEGPASPTVAARARTLLARLGLSTRTAVVLLNPVRLSGIVVRPAAISPLAPWLSPGASASLGPCRTRGCHVLVAGGNVRRGPLTATGIRLAPVGRAQLDSGAPLGFNPAAGAGQPPVLLTGDVTGLAGLPGLSSAYRTSSWLGALATARLQSWQLPALERRLERAEAALVSGGQQFTVNAPFAELDAARAQARAAPSRLLLAGGGALAALVVFVVLAAGALRRDLLADVARLQLAGARTAQCLAFVAGEAAALCAVALLAGAAIGVGVAALLAGVAGLPVGAVLTHSVVTPIGLAALAGGWVCATALLTTVLWAPRARVVDALALAAVVALVTALAVAPGSSGESAVLIAPLCCLAAGVLIFRASSPVLRGAARLARRGPLLGRLALIGLARSPGPASLAIAFIAIAVGLGGFALGYHATLVRGTADQAAASVPLDAIVSPTSGFVTPLELAPLARWEALSRGTVYPVRRTLATYAGPGAAVTEPAIGVPAVALARIHGWRASDGSAALATLARRLIPPGPVRNPGPTLPAGARRLSLRVGAPAAAITVTADLRAASGEITQVTLRPPGRATVPPGRWELDALELDEPSGLQATNGHQAAESPTGESQFTSTVTLGPVRFLSASGRTLLAAALRGWVGVGAASSTPRASDLLRVRFSETGLAGILRPPQPSDIRPVPVLADPRTAAAAGPGGRLGLAVDQQPVSARVVGVLRRFPTVGADASGFIVADEATLASALDAALPGQGRPDELWISTGHQRALEAALRTPTLSALDVAFRSRLERRLRSAPIADGVLGTLVAATALAAVLAVLGLMVAVAGLLRDREFDRDLIAQGFGPGALRAELRLRLLIAAVGGVGCGLAIGVLLTRVAVAAVRAAGAVAVPEPPLVTVAPLGDLLLWCAVAALALGAAALVGTRLLITGRTAS